MNESLNDVGRLPQGWAWATIAKLVASDGVFRDGDWVESKDQDPNGDIRLIQLADVGDGAYLNRSARFLTAEQSRELRCTYLQDGDVLVARMPEPLGRACIFPGDPLAAVTVVDVCIVRTGATGPDHEWLTQFINAPDFRRGVSERQSGSTRKRVSRNNLATIAIPLPPLPEQHRIVAEIEKQFTRLNASAAALKRAQANLKRYRASLLKAACEGRLVPTEAELARSEDRDYKPANHLLERILAERRAHWESQPKNRGKYKEPAPPDTSYLPELPEGWVWARLDQLLVELKNGYGKPPHGESGTAILRISAVRPMYVNLQDVRWVPDAANLSDYLLNAGDLLFTRYNGNASLVAACGLVPTIEQDVLHPDKLIRGRVAGKGAVPGFVQIAANCGNSRAFIERRIKTTAGQSGVSGSDLKEMPIPLPPLAEQHRMVAEVERQMSVIQKAEATVDASLKRVERLRQSILKQAFLGQLVPQDPNDEPASVLLERIRAEREASQARPKPKPPAPRKTPA